MCVFIAFLYIYIHMWMVQCWKMVNIKAFYSPFSTYSFAKTEVIPWCGPMFSVRSRELWPFYRLTLFEAQAEVIFFLRRWANTSQESWCRCVSLQLKCSPWFSILSRFVPFCPAKGRQPRNLLQVLGLLHVMLISCRVGSENPASCHAIFRRLKDFGQAIHQLQPGHVSRRTCM